MTMADYIEREAFVEQKRKQYCEDCDRRKGMKNGKYKTLYEIGEAPCRACGIDDMLNDVEDFPAADVREVVRCKDCLHFSYDDVEGGWCDEWGKEVGSPNFYCADADMREEQT